MCPFQSTEKSWSLMGQKAYLGSTHHPETVESEGLAWYPLVKM